MATVSSFMRYDFRSVRSRIQLLTMMYRQAKKRGDELACWALAAEIDELESEISEAHKKAAVLL